jgi:hypothetical protein
VDAKLPFAHKKQGQQTIPSSLPSANGLSPRPHSHLTDRPLVLTLGATFAPYHPPVTVRTSTLQPYEPMRDRTQDSKVIILRLNKETLESIMARTKGEKIAHATVIAKTPNADLLIASEDAKRAGANAEPVRQVDTITTWAEDQGIWYKFQKLPQPDFYTFRAVGKDQLKREKNLHKTKLYLGQNKHHSSWALIRIFNSNKKAVEVILQNELDDGDYEEVSDFGRLALMYPFRVFKDRGTNENMRHLKVMVQYAFLDSGEVERVFPDSMKTALTLLSSAMSLINNNYEAKGRSCS